MQEEVSLEGHFPITKSRKEPYQEHGPNNVATADDIGIPNTLVLQTPLPADHKPD
jgi:hypothetical protein